MSEIEKAKMHSKRNQKVLAQQRLEMLASQPSRMGRLNAIVFPIPGCIMDKSRRMTR
jgi:hypothetical protein